jgi:hypothetical protein
LRTSIHYQTKTDISYINTEVNLNIFSFKLCFFAFLCWCQLCSVKTCVDVTTTSISWYTARRLGCCPVLSLLIPSWQHQNAIRLKQR